MKNTLLKKPKLPVFRSTSRFLALLVAANVGLCTIPTHAQVVASPTAAVGASPSVVQGRGQAVIVNIAAPNASGVSHNQYDKFNVNSSGVVLNNSVADTHTFVGGRISGNPLLGSAGNLVRVIVNEVTSASSSTLKGVLEVGGSRADVVLVNPNGIFCDGCGFRNTGRATLSTGSPEFNTDGSLKGFDIGGGTIDVWSNGLNARGVEQLDLLAREIRVSGLVEADQINVIAGVNKVAYSNVAEATPQKSAGFAPWVAIDVSSWGSMYAKQIYLVATEKGAGVNSDGRLSTVEGNFSLRADGNLRVNEIYSAGDLNLVAQRGTLDVRGSVYGVKNVNVVADKILNVTELTDRQGTRPYSETLLNRADGNDANDLSKHSGKPTPSSVPASTQDTPLRGSVIAAGLRNQQAQAIEAAKQRFSEQAALKYGGENSGSQTQSPGV